MFVTMSGNTTNTALRESRLSDGAYTNKPPVINVLCVVNEVMLRAVETSIRTTYEIIYEGDIFSRSYDKAEAEVMFMDFAGIGKAKLKKAYAAMDEAKKKAAEAEAKKKEKNEAPSARDIFLAACSAA